MPPRGVVVFILLFWMSSVAFLVHRNWWQWQRTNELPRLVVDLADEAAPLTAHWRIFRQHKQIGTAMTRMICLKDDTIELQNSIDNLEIQVKALNIDLQFRVARLRTAQIVNREGEFLALRSRLNLEFGFAEQKFEMIMIIQGEVQDNQLRAHAEIHSVFGDLNQDLAPIPLPNKALLNPLQPLPKMHVRPGQAWKISHMDPLGEAIKATIRQLFQQALKNKANFDFGTRVPNLLLAQVDRETHTRTYENNSTACYVIHYREEAGEMNGSTWVDAETGMVLRQEISGFGELLVMEREN